MLGDDVIKSGERQEVSVLKISVDKAETLSIYEWILKGLEFKCGNCPLRSEKPNLYIL